MVILDQDMIKLIGYFEQKTRSQVKEAFYDKNEKLTFIVDPGQAGKAIGKGASTLRAMEQSLGKKIRVAEFSTDKLTFVQSLIAPLKLKNIELTPDDVIIMEGGDEKTNGLLIGKQARNLRNLEWMVRKFFEVAEIKVQ